jgi:hypothetical protein
MINSNLNEIPTVKQLGGYVVDLIRYVRKDNPNWSAFNPSIGYHPKRGLVTTIRSSNYFINNNKAYKILEGSNFNSEVWFSELDQNLKLKNLRKIDFDGIELKRGAEDAKVFYRDGAWHFTCVIMDYKISAARMAVAELDYKCKKVVDFTIYSGVDAKIPEKNWMLPYEKNPHFDFVYGPNATVKDNKLTVYMQDKVELSNLRGNTNLHQLGDGSYLAVVHSKKDRTTKEVNPNTFGVETYRDMDYLHYFAKYDKWGHMTHLSKPFRFYKPGVEFAGGIVMRGKEFLISFGKEDVSSHIASLPVATVLESLNPIKY